MNDTPERWLPIPGYEGRYDISDQGRVRSWMLYHHDPGPRILKGWADDLGYLRVGLSTDGRLSHRTIHGLMMLAFVGPCPDGLMTRHLNGVKTDLVLSNLRYGTRSQNTFDMVRHGVHNMASKTHCPARHEYTDANTYLNPQGSRECRTCKRAEKIRRRARSKGD